MKERVVRLLAPPGSSTTERLLRVLGLLLFLGLGVRCGLKAHEGSYDFDGFHRAAEHVLAQHRVLDAENVARYLPHFQVLHVPFALLPVAAAGVLWYLLSVAALVATPRELERLSGVAPRAQWPAWFVAAPYVIDNLALGQSGPVLLWATLAGVNACRGAAPVRGGALLGLAALFKVPVVALAAPALLLGGVRRGARTLVGIAAALCVTSAALVAFVGVDDAAESTARWVETIRTKQSPQGMVEQDQSLRSNNQSLPITLARTFGDLGGVRVKSAVRLARRPLPEIWRVAWVTVALLAVLGLAVVKVAERRGFDREAWLVVFSLAALGMLFVSPLVWTHYFMWALPALLALRAAPRKLVVAGCISIAGLAVPPARALGVHLLLAIVLYVAVAVRYLRAYLRARDAKSGDASVGDR